VGPKHHPTQLAAILALGEWVASHGRFPSVYEIPWRCGFVFVATEVGIA
jgi:hypothetical protein